MSTSVSPQNFAGSYSPIAPGQPGITADTAEPTTPGTRAGITAGTTPTSYGDAAPATTSASYLTPASTTVSAPSAADWLALGATQEDLAQIEASGLSAAELNQIYDEMYAQAVTATGNVNGSTGATDAATEATAATAEAAGPVTPGWNDDYAKKYADVMTAAGMSPEGVEVMVQQLASDPSLDAAALDGGLEFYASPEGTTQLQEIDKQVHAGVPLSAYLPLAGMALGAGTVLGGTGLAAYKLGDKAIQSSAVRLMERAAAGDARAINAIQTGKGGPAAARAAAMSGNGVKAAQMSDRARASLQMLYERKGGLATPAGMSIAPQIDDMIKHGFDAKGNPTGLLADLAKQRNVTKLAGESVESFAVRVAEKHGVHVKAPSAANFISGADTKAHFNNGGGTAFRPYATDTKVGPGWAAKRAAADRMGSILHPVERARLVAEANKVGPAATAIQANAAGGGSKLAGAGKGFASEIAARGTSGGVGGGLKGIGASGVKSFGSKLGAAGVVLGLGLESGLVPGFQGPDTIAGKIKEHGIDSKEAGNAIGGATGRTVGGIGGFAVGSAVGSAMGAAVVGATIGSAFPVAGTLVGGAIGLAVGFAAAYGGSKVLGAAGEHLGDGLSKVNKASEALEKKTEKVFDSVEDNVKKVAKHVPGGSQVVSVTRDAAEFSTKVVTNPVAAVKDAGNAAKKVGEGAVKGIKKLFGGD